MTTPLIVTDEEGKKIILQPTPHTGVMVNMGTGWESKQTYTIEPYIERKPLFTDLVGNPVHEGDTVYWYTRNGIVSCMAKHDLYFDKNTCFLRQSDCEKWVASNVKTMTREEALRKATDEILYFLGNTGISSGVSSQIRNHVENLIKETCLLTKDKV